MNGIPLFKEFIKYHEPKFRNTDKRHREPFFCGGMYCQQCAVEEFCKNNDNRLSYLTLHEFEQIKEEFPEYFI